jgi:Tol biopolymer transport system component
LRHIAYNGRYGKEALSPDGEWLVLEVNRGIRESLYVLRTNGSELNLLTDYPQDIRNSPAWSPDGEWIIFSSVVNGGTSGDTNIYRIRPNGSELQQITHLSNDYVEFKWTPDGHWITFRSGTFAGNSETYQIRSDGSDLHRVPYYILQATWGPPLKDTYRPAIPILIGGMMLIIGITPWKHLLRCLFRSTFKEIFSKPIGRCLHGQFKPE